MKLKARTSLGLFAGLISIALPVAGCCQSDVSFAESRYDIAPGRTQQLIPRVAGDIKSAAWEIVSAEPESCRGSIEAAAFGKGEAVFRAPLACNSDGAQNHLRLNAEFECGDPVRVPITVGVRRGISAPVASTETSAAPAAKGVVAPQKPGSQATSIVPQFGSESYFLFNDAQSGFRTWHERTPDALTVLLEAPQRAGFGGVCVASLDRRPLDVSSFSTLEVDLSTGTPQHFLDIKLEQEDSAGPTGQFNLNRRALPSSGRQVVRLPLDEASPALKRSVRRVCFAMNASGFRSGSLSNDVRVYQARFVR